MASRDLKGLTIVIGGDTSNLATALRDVDGELSHLQNNLRTVNSALRLDPSNVDALAQRQALLTDAVAETSRRLEILRDAQRQVDQQIADGVEVDQRAYRNLQSEIVRAEASLADYERQANEAGDTSREAAEESEEGWTIVKDVIADLASEAIQAAIQAFGELMVETEAAFDLLQAKIGASDEAMRKYSDVAKDVFKNGWGESIADVSESIGVITNMLGDLDEVELRNVTENAMTLRDVFGWDTQESVRAANSLMNQFGITSDEAFNLMVQGAQNGLDQNGDLLDTINEYSNQFHTAGFSADEMFNMLANGASEGTWSVDKLGDAVKEYNIRIKDGTVTKALKENYKALGLTKTEVNMLSEAYGAGGEMSSAAMRETLNAVLSVEDETERYKLGVAMFGTMWEDLGQDAVTALFETEGGIKSTNEAMSQAKTDAYDNLATSVTTLGRTLKEELLTPIVDMIAPVLKNAINWLIEHMNIVKPIVIALAAAFGVLATALAISSIISAVQKAFALLNATLLANPIVLIVAAIAGLVAAFVHLWNNCEAFRQFWINLWEGIKNALSVAWNAITGIFTGAWNIITGIWNGAASFFGGIWNGIKGAFSTVGNFFANTFSGAWNAVKNAWSATKSFFVNRWEDIKSSFVKTRDWFKETFSKAWEGVKWAWANPREFFANVWDGIKKVFSAVDGFFGRVFGDGWTKVKEAFSGVISFFTGVWNGIKNVFNKVGSVISDAVVKPVKNAINGVLSTAVKIINGFISAINFAIGIINAIPGVNIRKLTQLSVPKLATGAVVRKPMLAEIGEYPGANRNPEIVTPQDIMRETFDETLAKFALRNPDTFGKQGGTQRTEAKLDALFAIVSEYLPYLAKKSGVYLDRHHLVGELLPDIDEGLGEIASKKAVDAI